MCAARTRFIVFPLTFAADRGRKRASARAFPGFNGAAFFYVSFSLDFQCISTRREIAQLGSRGKRLNRCARFRARNETTVTRVGRIVAIARTTVSK